MVKNTAHLNFSPTEAMDTIEIKISLLNGTEKKTPRMINVHNLMRITTLLELKYHLAEKYKHLKVGELVRIHIALSPTNMRKREINALINVPINSDFLKRFKCCVDCYKP